jgi:lipoate-protein ligase A
LLLLNLENTDPFFNLAVEEYLLKNRKEDYLVLGINSSSVIIGKHQVAHRESDTRFVTQNNIPVIRRLSGGGAVYHDHGNLNYSFIFQSSRGRQVDFRKYTLPVLEFLASEGVIASFEGKNDLKINGLKISGNAEHVYHERVLHHGTLLFDTQINALEASLRKDTSLYSARAVKSNPSLVMNLKDKLMHISSIGEFRDLMLRYFLKQPGTALINLTPIEKAAIGTLAGSKYRTWEWNYAYGPEYQFSNRFEIENINYTCRIFVKDGIIRNCDIEGSEELAAAGKKMIGCRHMAEDILKVLRKENILISGQDIYNFF